MNCLTGEFDIVKEELGTQKKPSIESIKFKMENLKNTVNNHLTNLLIRLEEQNKLENCDGGNESVLTGLHSCGNLSVLALRYILKRNDYNRLLL